jgi:chorismate synthase
MIHFETGRGPVEIRELQTIEEMVAAESIQLQVWGPEIIPHPKELLIPVQHEGGLLAGAFTADGDMVGLVFGFPTRDPAVLHSQILGTLESWRGQGIGRRLKWFQRQWCLSRGINLVRWTVDPLRAANAELNIRHLGGVSSKYLPDYYGAMQGIDAGVPTDRVLVDWYLDSARVSERVDHPPADQGFPEAEEVFIISRDQPDSLRPGLACPQILLPIPEHFIDLARRDTPLALDWRMQTRSLFENFFSQGYRITGFTRQKGPAYLLEKDERGSLTAQISPSDGSYRQA